MSVVLLTDGPAHADTDSSSASSPYRTALTAAGFDAAAVHFVPVLRFTFHNNAATAAAKRRLLTFPCVVLTSPRAASAFTSWLQDAPEAAAAFTDSTSRAVFAVGEYVSLLLGGCFGDC